LGEGLDGVVSLRCTGIWAWYDLARFDGLFGSGAGSMRTDLGDARQVDKVAVRMANYRSLVARATDVFGDAIKASRWLSTPNADLAGRVPLEVAGIRDYEFSFLEPIFVRIEHGIDY
jgi:hypothetical protein